MQQKSQIALTVFESSLPISIVRRHKGIISVERRKLITSVSSTCQMDHCSEYLPSSCFKRLFQTMGNLCYTLTRAPITPKLVRRRYSKGLVLLTVFKNG